MKIVTVRRISQGFFVLLFLWFALVSTVGVQWWQLRGWPVNWFLQLDPLVAVGTVLSTGTLFSGLLWALVTIVLTVVLGRFFCGWVCPFGSLHQLVGFLGARRLGISQKVANNQYRLSQSLKYYLLVFLLAAAAGALLARLLRGAAGTAGSSWVLAGVLLAGAALAVHKLAVQPKRTVSLLLMLAGLWTALAFFLAVDQMLAAALQTGLLDPIALLHRSINLVLEPMLDATAQQLSASQRHYDGAWLVGVIFLTAVLLNLKIPRFYCRFLCPLGALFGVLGRFALWRIGKTRQECVQCGLCEAHCEGACQPTEQIRLHECVLCMNCLDECHHDLIGYRTQSSAAGEMVTPDLSRRGFMVTLASGMAAVPMVRLGGQLGANWNPAVIRPPGALGEEAFLTRCIKCGQCMRLCPTNIIQPAALEAGVEGLWTPILNFRIGTSGCQLNCVACSQICPTAAIRPLSLDEKLGRKAYAPRGPIRLGTAFVDRGRCLPWAMDKPCIVCQENCPVSPKAIFVQEVFNKVRGGVVAVQKADALTVQVAGVLPLSPHKPDQFASGDYYLYAPAAPEQPRRRIASYTDRSLTITAEPPWSVPPVPGSSVEIQVRLQRPQVDLQRCIGCGVCEHECPVSGQRAIRVSAENETRSNKHSLLL
jgi:polyferredoxin/ferredoxin